MYTKHLNHTGVAGLFLVAFASAAFAESEQLHEQQQIQQQQREQIQNREHMPSDQGLQQREQTRTMTEEQERLHQQQHQEMQEKAQQKDMMQQGGQGMGPMVVVWAEVVAAAVRKLPAPRLIKARYGRKAAL